MVHEEYIRMIPGADTAVLFIHGIVGSPMHFVTQMPLVDLVPAAWSVYNVLLDGHGKKVEDFSRTSMRKWREQVWRIFEELCKTHEKVVIVGHSMGTLFAMQLALERPEKVPFLFLLAAPMRPWPRLTGMVNCLRLAFGCIRENNPQEVATRDASSVQLTRKLWKYLGWTPRLLELFREIYKTERAMGGLNVPCVAYQSEKDEMVSDRSLRVLEHVEAIEVHCLPNSTHFYYNPADQKTVRDDFRKRCKEITHD